MRGRIGGRIGATVLPDGTNAKGVWGIGEVYAASRGYLGSNYYEYGPPWPTGTLSIDWGGTDYADATGTGNATFSPAVTTTYTPVYSWEKSTDSGATWTAVSGETTNTLSLTGKSLSDNGTLYRLVADAGLKVVRSASATLRYDTVTVAFDYGPSNMTSNTYAYFEAAATATGVTYSATYTPSYQWQESTDAGSTWSNISGATSGYLSFAVTSGMDGYRYRCVATFAGETATSSAATLTYGEGGF